MSLEQADIAGHVTLVDQITEMLVHEIKTGVLPDGEKLPAERKMAERLNISVGTLRKALSKLENLGLLHRVQGSGNYIHQEPDADNVYALFRLELEDGPAIPGAQLLSVRRLNKPADIPFIGKHRHAFRFRRIRQLNGVDSALEEIWLDGRFATRISADQVDISLYRFYRDYLGFRITRAEDRVSVARLPDWTPESLTLSTPEVWGFIERQSRDQDGELAEFSRTWFNPDHVRFVTR